MRLIELPPLVDRGAASTLAAEIADALGAGPVALDCSAVERIGQSGLQLLLCARTTADARGQRLAIRPSPALDDAARLAGLADAIFVGAAA